MAQPTNTQEFSMDFVLNGQPWDSRVLYSTANLFSMDYVLNGQPFVTWSPDLTLINIFIIE